MVYFADPGSLIGAIHGVASIWKMYLFYETFPTTVLDHTYGECTDETYYILSFCTVKVIEME